MSFSRQLEDIVALLSNCLDAFTAALFVWDDRRKLLILKAFHSLSNHIVSKAKFKPEDGGLIGWVAKNNQPLAVDHFDRTTKTFPYYQRDENIKSFMALPLDNRKGVLCVDSKRQYVFTNKAQKLLSGFATLIVYTLTAEQAYRRQHLLRQHLTLWHRADPLPADVLAPAPYLSRLLDSACAYLQADAGLVAIPIKEGACLQPVAAAGEVPEALLQTAGPTKRGVVGWIFRNRKSVMIPKFHSAARKPFLFDPKDGVGEIGALLGMPLAWQAEEVGGVIVFIRRTEARWNREEIAAITAVTRRATLVLQNFTLRRELALVRNVDPVTELCNTEAFDLALNKRWNRCRKASANLGLGVIRIEGFEALCSRVAFPDLKILRQHITTILLRQLKGKQLLGALGSAGFAVLIENQGSEQITAQLTAMTTAVQREVLDHTNRPWGLQCHYGFALYPRDAAAPQELWTMAFQKLANKKMSFRQKAAPDG